jgi:hypothetical protein
LADSPQESRLSDCQARETNTSLDKENSMNASILRTLLPLSLLATLGPARVMAQNSAYFKIPFDFAVGDKQLFAGEYLIGSSSPSVLTIRTGNGEAVMMKLGNAASGSAVPGKVALKFDKVDNRYFLSQWTADGRGLDFNKPEAEKELIARRTSAKPVTVVASRLK